MGVVEIVDRPVRFAIEVVLEDVVDDCFSPLAFSCREVQQYPVERVIAELPQLKVVFAALQHLQLGGEVEAKHLLP